MTRGGSSRATPKRRPPQNGKELLLQQLVMRQLGLSASEVIYEPGVLHLYRGHTCSFDLWLPGYKVHIERTRADSFVMDPSPKVRLKALRALEKKYRMAKAYTKLNPDHRVLVVTDAEWELLQCDPNRLRSWLGLRVAA